MNLREKVLVVGYGSIGKRHVRNLLGMGVTPYVLTQHPDKVKAKFFRDIRSIKEEGIEYCLISSATAKHLVDIKKCFRHLKGLKHLLIEKPLESSFSNGQEIIRLIKKARIEARVAYNLRFLPAFEEIRRFIQRYKNRIKIVEVVAGQDLRQWRPSRNLRQSYSVFRKLGGGVDLDLSHEIDYILWLFGKSFKDKFIYRAKIGNLTVDSPDIFKLILDYKKFIVDITLDYIRRPRQRYLRIICDNGKHLDYDFLRGTLRINGKLSSKYNGIDQSYKEMLKGFLNLKQKNKARLCSLKEGLSVLKTLEV